MVSQFIINPLSAEATCPDIWFTHGYHSHNVPKIFTLPGNDIFFFSKFSIHCLYIPEYYANLFKWISYFSCISHKT